MQTSLEMGKWRQRLWPVYSYEFKKFIPMVIMMFWILFNYTVVRSIKDALLVNAPHSSAHVLPWAKICVVTPASILFVLLYAKLSNMLSRDGLYYSCLVPFAIFFFFFAFLIYPYHEFFNASAETVLAWQMKVPSLKNLFPMIGYWTFTLFYAMAELWGNIGVAVLFWQFANHITPTAEAKRFYPIFGLWSNLGLLAAGVMLRLAKPMMKAFTVTLPTGEKDFSAELKLLCSCVTLGCLIVGLAYWWMGRYVLTDPRFYTEAGGGKAKEKPKLSVGESIKFLMKSKYLGYITVIVLAYGLIINVLEVSWKQTVKEYFAGDPGAYSAFMGNLYIYTGGLTMLAILLSQNILRVMGWKFSASVTPWVSLITGAVFFGFLIFKDRMTGVCALLHITPLGAAVWLGLAQNSITKAFKYALFDPTKEMAYIPLDQESKVKGKAAIDVVGGRAGKSLGSIVNIMAGALTSGFGAFCSVAGTVVLGIGLWWLWAVEKLSKAYHQKLIENEAMTPEESKRV